MVLVIDNYDSFTYNLVQFVGRFYQDIQVFRNDKISIDQIKKLKPQAIIISPGPKTPDEAGISSELVKTFYKSIPILGVCLGHQSIGAVFGGKIIVADEIKHGKLSSIKHDGLGIYKNLNNPLEVVRYHSLIISRSSVPDCLKITSETSNGIIMGVRHKQFPKLEGVQFHPESIKTEQGYELIENFLHIAGIV